ncbi:MAG: P1 family peptidase [Deltaproteobacteria bacterium]|jgi:D-aminopeptidase|nr:P1 family peptidase [Deltaproteobacteria bacterium]
MNARPAKPRARDLGLPFEGKPGFFNSITDVGGVEVGFKTIIEGEGPVEVGKGPIRTGVTAILPRGKRNKPSPIWAGQFNLNGNGEMTGTHWINEAGYFISPICITNTHSVGIAHHATVGWMIDQYGDFFQKDHAWAMPVIAETYDGLTNDICGRHVKEKHVLAALNSADSGPVIEGNVGGGTGMVTFEFKGGTGTSSREIRIGADDYTIGVLVQSNFGSRKDLNILGVPVGKHWPENAVVSEITGHETGSIIVIIGTDLPLLPIQLRRIAKRAAIGIGRTGTAGGNYSGDIFLALSIANDIGLLNMGGEQPVTYALNYINDHYFDDIFGATVQAIEEAIINAMIATESMTTIKPAGYTVEAIDHNKLRAIMKKYNRLNE